MNFKRVIFISVAIVLTASFAYGDEVRLRADTLDIDGTPSAPTGTIDMDIYSGIVEAGSTYADVRQYIEYAYDEGQWDREGLTSGVAEANKDGIKYALGIMDVADYQGLYGTNAPFYGPTAYPDPDFDTLGVDDVATLATDTTLVMFTYVGDGNFDGRTNNTDLTNMIDSISYLTFHPGELDPIWMNGDYNWDAIINNTDLTTMIDVIVYQTLNGTWTAMPDPTLTEPLSGGGLTPIPEPSVFILGLIAAACFLCYNKFRK